MKQENTKFYTFKDVVNTALLKSSTIQNKKYIIIDFYIIFFYEKNIIPKYSKNIISLP